MMFPIIHGLVGPKANYFGDGTDGDVTISVNTSETATEDGNPVIKHYKTLTINASVFLTANNRCKGFVAYVQGNCVINGTFKMDDRGASAAASEDLDLSRSESAGAGGGAGADPLFPDEVNQPNQDVGAGTHTIYKSLQTGAAGGAGGSSGGGAGVAGSAGAANETGGGGGGGGSDPAGAAGAEGEAFSGGTGGGAGGGGSGTPGPVAGALNGGLGGNGS